MFGVALATVLFRSAALAIGLGLIYSLVLETVVSMGSRSSSSSARHSAERFLLGANAGALANYFGGGGSTIPPGARHPRSSCAYLLAFVDDHRIIVVRRRDVA